jgi:antitoxin component YwqK of YwqJK toxin-antitoxin module
LIKFQFLLAIAILISSLQNDLTAQYRKGYDVDLRDFNGDGVVQEYGKPLMGYSYNILDTSQNGKITAIIEFRHNKRNGRRIQFFNYPYDTASVENYRNDTLNGPYYYNHMNGKVWVRGVYENGLYKSKPEYWGDAGQKINENVTYDSLTGLHYLDGELCEGLYSIYGYGGLNNGLVTDDVWFTHGKIDSSYSYRWAYWGKSSEIRRNYIDSSRVYWNYYQEFTMCQYSGKMMRFSSNRIQSDGYHLVLSDVDNVVMHGEQIDYHNRTRIVSIKSYYNYGEKVGVWKFYDLNGNLIRTEQH